MHESTKSTDKQLTPSLAFALGTIIIYACYFGMYYFMPAYGDDIWFYRDYVAQAGSDQLTFEGIWKLWQLLWHTDPARFTNLFLIAQVNVGLTGIWRPIVLAIIPTILTTLIAWIGRTAICGKKSTAGALALTWLTISIVLPWSSNLFTATMLLSYLASAVMILLFLTLLISTAERRLSPLATSGLCLLALVAGWMHEGATVPVGFGLLAWAISRKFRFPIHTWLGALFLLPGLLIDIFSPMLMNRTQLEGEGFHIMLRPLVMGFWFVGILATMWVYLAAKSATRKSFLKWLTKPFVMILASATFVAFVMWTMINQGNTGTSIFPRIFAIVLFVATIEQFFILPRFNTKTTTSRRHKTLTAIATGVVYCALIIFFAISIFQTRQLRRHYDNIYAELSQSASGTIFRDVKTHWGDLPLDYVPHGMWRNYLQILSMNQYAPHPVNVVPSVLKDFTADKARLIPGDANLLEYRGELIAPDEQLPFTLRELPCEIPVDHKIYSCTFGTSNISMPFYTMRLKFTATDGIRWLYLQRLGKSESLIPTTANRDRP